MKLDIYGLGYAFPGTTNYNDGRGSVAVTLSTEVVNTPDNSLVRLEHDLIVYQDLAISLTASPFTALVEDTDYIAGDAANTFITQAIRDARGDQTLTVVNGFKIINPTYYSVNLDVDGVYAGDQISSRDWNNVLPPVGSVIAWHKSLTGVPSIPDNYLECNGQVVSDSESPVNGQTLPDLNGDERFLRGGATSGTLQAFSTEDLYAKIFFAGGGHGSMRITTPEWTINAGAGASAGGATGNVTNGTEIKPLGTAETRPINMSVVWIMRIK